MPVPGVTYTHLSVFLFRSTQGHRRIIADHAGNLTRARWSSFI